jgi:hypothetical protein
LSSRPAAGAWAEALAELSRRRVELAAHDRVKTVADHAAIHVGHIAGHRKRFRRRVGGESRRQQQPCRCLGRFALGCHRFHDGPGILRLHVQRLESSTTAGCRRLRRGVSRAARRECKLQVCALRARLSAGRNVLLNGGEPGELRFQSIRAGRNRQLIGAVNLRRRGCRNDATRIRNQRNTGQRSGAAAHAAADAATRSRRLPRTQWINRSASR